MLLTDSLHEKKSGFVDCFTVFFCNKVDRRGGEGGLSLVVLSEIQ